MRFSLQIFTCNTSIRRCAGNRLWLSEHNVSIAGALEDAMVADEVAGRTSVLCAVGVSLPAKSGPAAPLGATSSTSTSAGQVQAEKPPARPKVAVALVSVEDVLKKDAGIVVGLLQNVFHKQVLLITGDNKRTAIAVARQLGIGEVCTCTLPICASSKFFYFLAIPIRVSYPHLSSCTY